MWCTVDIVEAIKPKYVIWENVKNLLSKKHVHNFNDYIEIMSKLGYNSYFEVLNAKDFGVPQNRERVYTISIRKDIDSGTFKFPQKQELKIRLKDILETNVDEKYYLNDDKIQKISKWNSYQKPLEKVLGKNSISPTLTARGAGEEHSGMITYSDDLEKTTDLQRKIINEPKCMRIDGLFDTKNSKHQAESIYDKEEIAQSLDSMQCGYRQPMITTDNKKLIDNPLKGHSQYGWHFEQNVYSENTKCCRSVKSSSGSGNIPKIITIGNYSPSNHDASRIVDENGIAPTVKENHGTVTAVAYTKQNNEITENTNKIIYEKPLERKGWHKKACEVLNTDGISTCIHTQSNNLLQKIKVEERFFRQALEVCQENELQNGDTIDAFNKKVNSTGISPTITTRPEGFKTAILPIQNYRIRKLTPKECWRLMGFNDEDIEKCISIGISNSQLYKQARQFNCGQCT